MNKLLVFLFLAITPIAVWAQPGGGKNLPSDQVDVITDFEAALEETEKVQVKPEMPEVDAGKRTEQNYNISLKRIPLKYGAPTIKPIAVKTEKTNNDVYKGFIKLGYGSPNSPLAQASYYLSDPGHYQAGIEVFHHSANFKKLENQRFRNTNGKINGTWFSPDGYAINGRIGYTSDEVHFYGYDHEASTYAREGIKQNFNTFTAGAKIFNGTRTTGDINYSADVDLYAMRDNYAAKETGLLLTLGGNKWFNERHSLDLQVITDFSTFNDTIKKDLHNFFIRPSFTYHGDFFKVKLGANVASHKDEFYLYPDLEATVNILGKSLGLFLGWQGGLYKNNFKNLAAYNPFILSRIDVRNTFYHDYYGGIRGNVGLFEYSGKAGYKTAKNLALFNSDRIINNPLDTLRFNVLYDTANIVYIQGGLTIRPVKDLEIGGNILYNIYDLQTEDKPWHLPAITLNATAIYTTFEGKLRVKGDLFIENGVPYRDLRGFKGNLNGLLDLNIGVHYQATKNFGVFVDFNNLAANKRQRWFRYPTYGLNVMGGITARF